jgi:riboflavin synthase
VFTGLVEAVGKLKARATRGPGARLSIETTVGPLALGESVAVMGVCLTVDAIVAGGFEADASTETLRATTLGALATGSEVHLERAIALGARLGGHMVSGHVDGTAALVQRREAGQAVELTYGLPAQLARFVASKGSIALDGVSLTVNELQGDRFTVMIVPHTRQATLLADRRPGVVSNLEVDILARYVVRWLETRGSSPGAGPGNDESLLKRLASSGYL